MRKLFTYFCCCFFIVIPFMNMCSSVDIVVRELRFHELEAPETVSVSEESFTIELTNTTDPDDLDVGCYEPDENSIACFEKFFWEDHRNRNTLELTAKASHGVPNEFDCSTHELCEGCAGVFVSKDYTINGPFEAGEFHIIFHQPDGTTLEKTVEIVE